MMRLQVVTFTCTSIVSTDELLEQSEAANLHANLHICIYACRSTFIIIF